MFFSGDYPLDQPDNEQLQIDTDDVPVRNQIAHDVPIKRRDFPFINMENKL
jgi:hypothetical protein